MLQDVSAPLMTRASPPELAGLGLFHGRCGLMGRGWAGGRGACGSLPTRRHACAHRGFPALTTATRRRPTREAVRPDAVFRVTAVKPAEPTASPLAARARPVLVPLPPPSFAAACLTLVGTSPERASGPALWGDAGPSLSPHFRRRPFRQALACLARI